MTRQSKSEREFDKRMHECTVTLNAIERGRMDHLFANAQEKAEAVAYFKAAMEAAINRYVRANPGQLHETPDGKIGAPLEGANITPLRGPPEETTD